MQCVDRHHTGKQLHSTEVSAGGFEFYTVISWQFYNKSWHLLFLLNACHYTRGWLHGSPETLWSSSVCKKRLHKLFCPGKWPRMVPLKRLIFCFRCNVWSSCSIPIHNVFSNILLPFLSSKCLLFHHLRKLKATNIQFYFLCDLQMASGVISAWCFCKFTHWALQ